MLYFELNTKVPLALTTDECQAIFNRTAEVLRLDPNEERVVSLVSIGPRAMQKLNLASRSKDEATDILAFPLEEKDAFTAPPYVTAFFGEIVLCPSVARRKAKLRGMTLTEYERLLLAHGLLHLFGHDHKNADDSSVMESMEKKILSVSSTIN